MLRLDTDGLPAEHEQNLSRSLILPNLLAHNAANRADSLFLQEVDGAILTYRAAAVEVDHLARAIHSVGVVAGDRVVGMLPNTIDGVLLWLACAKLGVIYCPMNVEYKGIMLSNAIEAVEPVLLFVAEDLDAVVVAAVPELARPGAGVRKVTVGPGGIVAATAAALCMPNCRRALRASLPLVDQEWGDIACLMFTSGTTGRSKPVAVRWLQLFETGMWVWQGGHARPTDRIYSPWPLNHVSGAGAVYLMATVGGCVVLKQKWSTSSFFEDVYNYGCTMTTLMAEMVRYVDELPLPDRPEPCPLDRVFVAPVRQETLATMERLNARLCTVYNSTEMSAPITSQGFEPVPVGSCGRVRAGYEIRIVHADGSEVTPGRPGELLVRPADPRTMAAGYWNMPEATAEKWRDGWFHTGDLARQDDQGWVYFMERMNDRIRVRGENVSPLEMEEIVNALGGVRQSAVVGVRERDGDDRIILYVLPDGPDLTVERLDELCRATLPRYMYPAEIRLIANFPETPTGKIQRAKLREQAGASFGVARRSSEGDNEPAVGDWRG